MTEVPVEKESIVKTLLTSTTPLNLQSKLVLASSYALPRTSGPNVHYVMPQTHSRPKLSEEVTLKSQNCYNQFSDAGEKEQQGIIAIDHCYARPLNWTPESAFYQPTKTLFVPQAAVNRRKSTNPLAPSISVSTSDEIDVETVLIAPPELYDKSKAMQLMGECERHAMFGNTSPENEDWEESISKLSWTHQQHKLFNGVVTVLNNERLARLAYVNSHHEPVSRRLSVDKAGKRFRSLLANVSWDSRITQWLHQLLVDNLPPVYLGCYLDILQTLKAKLPTFVDKMMYGPNSNNRVGIVSNESLFHLLKRPWDPFALHLSHNRPRKLPGSPVLVIVPSAPSTTNSSQFRRQHKWINLLSSMATVVTVHINVGNTANRLTMTNCADQMLSATRAKVQEVKNDYAGKPIILVGFNAGSALALQVAQTEHVTCVVCLGFSVLTAEGKRGEPDDSLLELQCPVLFVIGQCSNSSLQEDVEDLRERMRVENGLIVVGYADDYLRVSKRKRREEGITQAAVDRIIAENIGEFISRLMLSPYPPQVRQSPTHVSSEMATKRIKIERKRNNSNGSSIDSEPPSPTPKISRPVGRPPGSKSKAKLEAKWAAQIAQGIPSPISYSPPPPLALINTDTLSTLQSQTPEISPNDKSTVKAVHSLDPSKTIEKSLASSPSKGDNVIKSVSAANMQTLGLSRSVLTGNTMYNIQGGCRPLSQTKQSGIKVLENLTLNTGSSAKLISSAAGKSIDLSKITVLNSIKGTSGANMIVMPDGKIRSFSSSVKGTGSTPLLLPISNKSKIQSGTPSNRVPKYITSKKQLLGRRPPPYPPQKPSIVPSYSSSLPPPTNLTSQDIMDLPIIFADDNQMLTDNSKLQQSDVPVPEIVHPSQPTKLSLSSNPVGKFVFINKQVSSHSMVAASSATTTPVLKRPAVSVPIRANNNPVKYTKIIISRAPTDGKTVPTTSIQHINNLSEISIRRVEPQPPSSGVELIDLEKAIAASTIPKVSFKQELELKKDDKDVINTDVTETVDLIKECEDDPDYFPPSKLMKLQ